MKKYYLTVTNLYGAVLFRRRSYSAEKLIKNYKNYERESYSPGSNYFGRIDTNIPNSIWEHIWRNV